MDNQVSSRLDLYNEICPASAAIIIGMGLLTGAVGALPAGATLIAAGIAVGAVGPVRNNIHEWKARKH